MARIDDIKLKAEWANQHIGYLNVALTSFGAHLYKIRNDFIGTEINPQTRQKRFYIKQVPIVPSNISLITADILGNLRSALDHLAYGMAGAISPDGIVVKPKEIYFPIADTSDKYMLPEFRRKVERLGKEAVKRLDLIKPYQGGNGAGHVLWQLDQLNNLAKHRLLVTVAVRYKERTFTSDDLARMRRVMPKADPGVLSLIRRTNFGVPVAPLKVGDEIYVKKPHSQEKVSFTFEVAFNEPQIIKCESLFETLQVMFKLVENNIIPRFADLV
jgi:hypothetical protein